MILKKLIDEVDAIKMVKRIIKLFPKEKDSFVAYEWLIKELKDAEPLKSQEDITIVVCPAIDIFDESNIENRVCGYSAKEHRILGIELCSHQEWLGMKISEESIKHYGEETYLAYVLHQMAFFGFNDEQIKNIIDDLEDSVREFEQGDLKLVSVNELFKEFETLEISSALQKTKEELDIEKERIKQINQKNMNTVCALLGVKEIKDSSLL